MGGRSYPIWHEVTACIYNSSKSYGAKKTSEETIKVGTSKKNSHDLVKVVTTCRQGHHPKYGDIIRFRYSVDDVILKEALFKQDTKGNAGEHIKTRTKLNSVKSLRTL